MSLPLWGIVCSVPYNVICIWAILCMVPIRRPWLFALLWHPKAWGGLGAVFVLLIKRKSGTPRIPQSPAGIAPARLCF